MQDLTTQRKLSFKEIASVFEELELRESDIAWMEFDEDATFTTEDGQEIALGPFKEVYREREGSDKDQAVCVIYSEKHDVYIGVDGYYSSNDGSTYDNGPYEVRPKEVTVTIYEQVEN